jgi:hypothetical protein
MNAAQRAQKTFLEAIEDHLQMPELVSVALPLAGVNKLVLVIQATSSEQCFTCSFNFADISCLAINNIRLHFTGDPTRPLPRSDPGTAPYNALDKLECMASNIRGKRFFANNVLVS